jgi:glycerol-3-phosphate acyltransferase PlsX
MQLAVDVMGADHGLEEMLHGAAQGLAAEPAITALHLVGNETEIRTALRATGIKDPRLHITHASEVLTMDDKPQDIRRKRDCSLLRAIELVRDGKAQAVISPGNTGGLFAAASIRLRSLPGVERPALACIMPSGTGAFVLLDGGANPVCEPLHLLQFAVMGSLYAQHMLGIESPRVGVLSNGTEDGKGTDLTRATLELVRRTPLRCIGHCEGHALFADEVDVVVCDGFTGNIVLKTAESLGSAVIRLMKQELTANPKRQLGALLAANGLRRFKHRMNPENYGGAPFLGLNGNVFKIHGSARRTALRHAISQACRAVSRSLNDLITLELERVQSVTASPA